jgi:hypothetical protein
MERWKPNCAPDAVAIVVAPPGLMVAVRVNIARGQKLSITVSCSLVNKEGQTRAAGYIRITTVFNPNH